MLLVGTPPLINAFLSRIQDINYMVLVVNSTKYVDYRGAFDVHYLVCSHYAAASIIERFSLTTEVLLAIRN